MAESWTARARRLLARDLLVLLALIVATVAVFGVVVSHDPERNESMEPKSSALHDSKRAKVAEDVHLCPTWKTNNPGASLVALARAGGRCRASSILLQWSPAQIDEARKSVRTEFLLIPLYVITIAWACLRGRRWIRFALGASLIAGLQVVAGLADVGENLLLQHLLGWNVRHATAWWATVCFNIKICIIGAGLLFGAFAVGGRIRELWEGDVPKTAPLPDLPAPGFPAALELEHEPLTTLVWNWFRGVKSEPVLRAPQRAEPVHGSLGICCSGGGIRSAAYNLGALQALNDAKEYEAADYVSAVSGGAYIAAAYAVLGRQSPPAFHPGSPEEQYLRNHSSYLAPGVTGKLSLLWRVIRGLTVNLALIFLLLAAAGLGGGWLVRMRMDPAGVPAGSKLTVDGFTEITLGTRAFVEHEDLAGRVALDEGSTIRIKSLELVVRRGVSLTATEKPGRASSRLVGRNEKLLVTPDPVTVDGASGSLREATLRVRSGGTLGVPANTILQTGDGATLHFVGGSSPQVQISRLSQVQEDGAIVELCRGGPCVAHRVPWWVFVVLWSAVGAAAVLGVLEVLLRVRWAWSRGLERWSLRFAVFAIAWLVLAIGLPEIVEILLRNRTLPAADIGGVSGGGLLALLAGVLADLTGARGKPTDISAQGRVREAARKLATRIGPRLRSAFVALIGGIVGPLLIVTTLVLFVTQGAKDGVTTRLVFVVSASGLGFLLLWSCGDLIQWSAHPMYKRRLWSAFVLRRYEEPPGTPRAEEVRDYDRPLRLESLPVTRPQLVVCAAANVSTQGVAPPGRPVSTFTFERDAVGGGLFGKLHPLELEALADGEYARYVTVASAFAISGAAVSPAMGKMTKRRFTFLMALANVRLGVWLPNPLHVRLLQRRSTETFWKTVTKRSSPQDSDVRPQSPDIAQEAAQKEADVQHKEWLRHYVVRPHYLLMELLGWNSYRRRFVYVTDGGHFENLGLVELLRRGCTHIYCFDASGGDVDAYTTLGEAVALARSELGVDIDIKPERMSRPPGEQYCADDHVEGTITFPGSSKPDGWIVFCRAAVTKGAPWDVRSYAQKDPNFPTHSTLDQLYTDEKFEAYRKLGNFTAERAIRKMQSLRASPT